MPTEHSWTDSVTDVGHLLRFRGATVRRPRAAALAAGVIGTCTLAAMLGPLLLEGAGADGAGPGALWRDYLPAMLAGFVTLSIASSVASGGGRELLPRDQAAIHPISTLTEHLGALLLSPLNFAFLLQAWILLASTAFVTGTDGWVGGQLLVLLWIACATAVAQAVGWTVEIVRRGEHGVAIVRGFGATVALVAVGLQLSGRLLPALNAGLTRQLAAVVDGSRGSGAMVLLALGLLVVTGAAVGLGARPAAIALSRSPRDELKVESGSYPARPMPTSDLAMLVRIDRASVWRSVPTRRGLIVLSLGPGLVALAGGMAWTSVMILPGLVISGGALLFGVNSWCLDGRGVLWRESLPVAPRAVFRARARVLAESLSCAAALTIVLASMRAGLPTLSQAVAVLCVWLVITLQVVAVAMSWSGRRPFSVDLRSARATPAPPLVMVGYSARLALSTTFTALLFSATSVAWWWLSPLLAVPFVAWSLVRLRRAERRWVAPTERAAVVMTVAA